MAKIKIIRGNRPFMLIAPHGGGPTDLYSGEQTEYMAKLLDCSAVINFGWKRPWKGNEEGTGKPWPHEKPDIKNGIANLNDLIHCRQNPLRDEFLKPINKLKSDIVLDHSHVTLYIVHGMDDLIRDYNGVNLVVGDGAGTPDRLSCSNQFSTRFINCLDMWFYPARGKAGGRLSGWDQNNLNQMFRTDPKVTSVQIEMGLSVRSTLKDALYSAEMLAKIININHNGSVVPKMASIPER